MLTALYILPYQQVRHISTADHYGTVECSQCRMGDNEGSWALDSLYYTTTIILNLLIIIYIVAATISAVSIEVFFNLIYINFGLFNPPIFKSY